MRVVALPPIEGAPADDACVAVVVVRYGAIDESGDTEAGGAAAAAEAMAASAWHAAGEQLAELGAVRGVDLTVRSWLAESHVVLRAPITGDDATTSIDTLAEAVRGVFDAASLDDAELTEAAQSAADRARDRRSAEWDQLRSWIGQLTPSVGLAEHWPGEGAAERTPADIRAALHTALTPARLTVYIAGPASAGTLIDAIADVCKHIDTRDPEANPEPAPRRAALARWAAQPGPHGGRVIAARFSPVDGETVGLLTAEPVQDLVPGADRVDPWSDEALRRRVAHTVLAERVRRIAGHGGVARVFDAARIDRLWGVLRYSEVVALAEPARGADAAAALAHELAQLRAQGPTLGELQQAFTAVRREITRDAAEAMTPLDRAKHAALNAALPMDAEAVLARLDTLAADTTRDDMRTAIARWFADDRVIYFVRGPRDPETTCQTVEAAVARATDPDATYATPDTAAEPDLAPSDIAELIDTAAARPKPLAVRTIAQHHESGVVTAELEGGVRVIVSPIAGAATVSVRLELSLWPGLDGAPAAGSALDKPGAIHAAASVLGAPDLTALDPRLTTRVIERHPTPMAARHVGGAVVLGADAAPDQLRSAIAIVASSQTRARVNDAAIERWRSAAFATLDHEQASPTGNAWRTLHRILHHDDPARVQPITLDAARAVTPADVRAAIEALRDIDPVLIVTGAVDPTDAIVLAATYLPTPNWTDRPRVHALRSVRRPDADEQICCTARPVEAIGFALPNFDEPDALRDALIAAEVLEDRIPAALEAGNLSTRGVRIIPRAAPIPIDRGVLAVIIERDASDNADDEPGPDAIARLVLSELASMAAVPPSEDELRRAVARWAAKQRQHARDPAIHADRCAVLVASGVSPTMLAAFDRSMDEATTASIARAAARMAAAPIVLVRIGAASAE